MAEDLESFLAHHGVKGMKWGQRKQDGGTSPGSSSFGSKKPDLSTLSGGETVSKKDFSRKEVKRANKANKEAYDVKKTEEAYAEAKAGGERVLVKSRAVGDYADTVMTGKDFASYVESGGLLNVASTRVFARQAAEGEQFVMNNFQDEVYRPIKRK
uniref:Uncharacterized protein n=1 Tax=Gordonia phage Petito TaxID=3158876 RepID=A0AAU8GPK6_9CAUD